MKGKIYKPPSRVEDFKHPAIFLAGSIEMGKAINWQAEFGKLFSEVGITVFDPRRDDWDSSWKQSYDNPQFREQVEWEIHGLELCDAVYMFFDPLTKSPITLMELGVLSQSKPGATFVVCPKEFYRQGNVEVLARYYGLHLYENSLVGAGALIAFLTKPK